MSPRLFGRLGEDVGFLSRLSRPRHARPARPRRPRARRGRPRLLRPPSRAAQPPSSPAAPDAARPPCGETCVFWPPNRVLARRTRPFARRGRSSPAKAQVGGFDKADAPSDRGRSVPELGLLARNRERADMERETRGARKRQTRGRKPRARGHEGALGCGVLEAIARGGRRCGRGGMRRALRGCGAPCGGGGRATRLAAPRERPVRRRNHADAKGRGNARGVGVKARARSCASVAAVGGRRRCDRADRALLHACSKFLLAENCMEGGPACP